MKHTPTPWRVNQDYQEVFDGDGKMMANCKAFPAILREESQANAAFIVEACNSYEKHVAQIQHLDSAVRAQAAIIATLLQSLKETLDIVHDEICLPLAKIGGGCSIVHTEAKKAIALCEGGAE